MPIDESTEADAYLEEVAKILSDAAASERSNVAQFAKLWADAITDGKLLYVFGSGHSRFIAGELYWRAGGLAPVNIIDDPTDGAAERVEGYAATFVEQYDVGAGDIALVISNSGINAVPLEVALFAKGKGATVVALTSVAHSRSATSRHSSGKKLFEVADIVIDSQVPPGDAIRDLRPSGLRAGPVSTVISTALLNAVVVQTARNILNAGGVPPVLISANVAVGDDHNKRLAERYWRRLTRFPRLGQF